MPVVAAPVTDAAPQPEKIDFEPPTVDVSAPVVDAPKSAKLKPAPERPASGAEPAPSGPGERKGGAAIWLLLAAAAAAFGGWWFFVRAPAVAPTPQEDATNSTSEPAKTDDTAPAEPPPTATDTTPEPSGAPDEPAAPVAAAGHATQPATAHETATPRSGGTPSEPAPREPPTAPTEPDPKPAETAAAPAAPEPAPPEKEVPVAGPFDTGAASAALSSAAGAASACRKEGDPSGMARVSVTFAPSGRVTSANVSGPPFAGTATGGCIAATMRRAHVPPFTGPFVTVSKTVVIH